MRRPFFFSFARDARRLGRGLGLGLGLLLGACGGLGTGTDSDMGGTDTDAGAVSVQPMFSSLYGSYLSSCKQCHAPGAPGRTSDIEKTLDFTSKTTAFSTLTMGKAMGLVGNHTSCNSAQFVVAGTPTKSLLVACLDSATRKSFDQSATPGCDDTAISDETVKVGMAPPDGFVDALKLWVVNGAANN